MQATTQGSFGWARHRFICRGNGGHHLIRHEVLDDGRMFRTIRSGLALYRTPLTPQAIEWQVPKGRSCLQKSGVVMTFPPL